MCHSLSLASAKSRLVLSFWYRLTSVVLDKGPLNGCVYVCCALNMLHMLEEAASVMVLESCLAIKTVSILILFLYINKIDK